MSDPILFYNGVIHTLDPVRPHCTWFTVLGKSIQRVGDGDAPQTKTKIDLKSKVVVPGFVDAHTHFFQTGLDKLISPFFFRKKTSSMRQSWASGIWVDAY